MSVIYYGDIVKTGNPYLIPIEVVPAWERRRFRDVSILFANDVIADENSYWEFALAAVKLNTSDYILSGVYSTSLNSIRKNIWFRLLEDTGYLTDITLNLYVLQVGTPATIKGLAVSYSKFGEKGLRR